MGEGDIGGEENSDGTGEIDAREGVDPGCGPRPAPPPGIKGSPGDGGSMKAGSTPGRLLRKAMESPVFRILAVVMSRSPGKLLALIAVVHAAGGGAPLIGPYGAVPPMSGNAVAFIANPLMKEWQKMARRRRPTSPRISRLEWPGVQF